MEDDTKQPLTTNASLYNGLPTDTGSSCPSARLTSCTPSISKNKGGVSVENVLGVNRQWAVLRVSYGRIIKAKGQQFQLLGNLLKSMKLEEKRCESINIKPIRRNTDYYI